MELPALEETKARILDRISAGQIEDVLEDLLRWVECQPDEAEGWLNLGLAEERLGRKVAACEHLQQGINRLRWDNAVDRTLIVQTMQVLTNLLEELDQATPAIALYREWVKNDSCSAIPWVHLCSLLARAGCWDEAAKIAGEYCRVAVSILAEKPNIAPMLKFQKALKEAQNVDGGKLLAATRQTYVSFFEQTLLQLPAEVQCEVEDDAAASGSRRRVDAFHAPTGERWQIGELPTYGFPEDSWACAQGNFLVPFSCSTPFPVWIATRTAWDDFFVRIRLANMFCSANTFSCLEKNLSKWFLDGMEGKFAQQGRGFFHSMVKPFIVGDNCVRYQFDLGLAPVKALEPLWEVLSDFHRQEAIEVVVLGDGAFPLR